MEQLSTIIQVVGSLITLVILPLLLLRSKKKKADAEAEKPKQITSQLMLLNGKNCTRRRKMRVVELDAKIDHLYTEITKLCDAIRELSEKEQRACRSESSTGIRKCNKHGLVQNRVPPVNINQINKYEDID